MGHPVKQGYGPTEVGCKFQDGYGAYISKLTRQTLTTT